MIGRRERMRIAVLLGLGILWACSRTHEAASIDAAEAEVISWLSLLDAGRYDDAWQQAAPEFRARTTREAWAPETRAARPQGKMSERRIVSRQYFPRFRNGPERQHVNLLSQVFLPNGRTYGELLTAVEAQGAWRVYGYKIVGARAGADPADR